jgi:oligopeptide transport system substrate-binding protein
MWKDALNIDITLANEEWKVYLDTVDQMDFQMARRGWIGDYVDPNNFLDLFLCEGGNNSTGFCDPVYDDMILQQGAAGNHTGSALRHFSGGRDTPDGTDAHHSHLHLHQQPPDSPSVDGCHSNLMDSLNLKYVHWCRAALPEALR